MQAGIKFDALLAQPGPESAPPAQPPDVSGGTILNDAVLTVNKTAPIPQARMAKQAALEALKKLAHSLSQERHNQ